MGSTLAEKVWQDHVVRSGDAGAPDLLYIDLHLLHEVTSPQAFDGLRLAGRPVHRTDLTIATEDHNTPTENIFAQIADPVSRLQIETLRRNCAEFGVRLHPLGDAEQGIVHVVGPQLGLTQPGMTIVCGDSHTSTHGAFGALAFGIGTSEVEHVLATQTLPLTPFKTMAINVEGDLPEGSTAKDIILAIIGEIGTAGGTGYVIEYAGEAIRALSMEGRMTICNMSIEGGARAGLIAPDETTFAYVKDKPRAPKGEAWDRAVEYWSTLNSDEGAHYDKVITTRTFADRLETLANVRDSGIKVCSGGILGLGEGVQDRVDMLVTLANLPEPPESVPVNMLIPIEGTPLGDAPKVDPIDFVRAIATARILMPASHVRLSAGRTGMSDEMQALCFFAGANSIFVGDTLLTADNPGEDADSRLLAKLGLVPMDAGEH